VVGHPELDTLSIVHIDADAFYAAIEKRDDPSLGTRPVIVGGSRQRGVVTTACYIARKYGVHSAMPMFEALRRCPQAVVIPPNMAKYAAVAREIRALMFGVTPLVEPLSLDEAYLDLGGTARLHGRAPAKTAARLVNTVEREIGITVSVGLSYNKFLAKLASDLDKPRGFVVIGVAEAMSFLRDKPVAIIRGVGPVLRARLARDGVTRIGQVQDSDGRELVRRYGETGAWLYRLGQGIDTRRVRPDGEARSISAETTFAHDIADAAALERILWRQTERVSRRAKAAELGGRTVTLKLKTSGFRIMTRRASLESPTQLAHVIFRIGRRLLAAEAKGTQYRLLGIGLSELVTADICDPPDLVDSGHTRRTAIEHAIDDVRAKYGDAALRKGIDVGS
jgi:DNA polymerase IV